MMEWISLQEASERYKIPKQQINNLIQKKVISSSKLGNFRMVDNTEIQEYLYYHKTNRQTTNEKFFSPEEEENEIYNEKKIFNMTSFYNIFHIMKMIFDEMLLLISDNNRREIFTDLCLNGNIKKTAEAHGINSKTAFHYYNMSKKEIHRKAGFLKSYRKEKAELLLTIRKYIINEQNLLNEIKQLKDHLKRCSLNNEDCSDLPSVELVSVEVARILSLSLRKDLLFSARLMNSMESEELETVEDLLRFIKEKGIDRLLTLNGYGEKSHMELKEKLLSNGILNEENEIPLLKYIY